MNEQQIIATLAQRLDKDGMEAITALVEKVASNAGTAAVTAAQTQKESLHKLAQDLATAGFSFEEVDSYLDKIAEHRKQAAEVSAIIDDCTSMGTIMGKTASQVQREQADELATYIGKKAAAVHIAVLQGMVDKTAMEDDEDKEEKKDDDDKKEEGLPPAFLEGKEDDDDKEEDSEKEASARVAQLASILMPAFVAAG